jgi:hypothetical protein
MVDDDDDDDDDKDDCDCGAIGGKKLAWETYGLR